MVKELLAFYSFLELLCNMDKRIIVSHIYFFRQFLISTEVILMCYTKLLGIYSFSQTHLFIVVKIGI
jgi:hypothetical protein